ncbi:MAG TPA: SCO family protein [Candidatus Xenobia bacterium]|nr:SCO family protein [Candidatus Xenobia bacterium]
MKTRRVTSGSARRRAGAGVLAVWCALSLGGPPVAAQSAAEVIQQVKFEQRINQPLPLELEFRDDAGQRVALRDYFGQRPVVLALVYYECPMLCTYVLDGLVKSLKPISFNPGQDFEVVVVSFNPNETPQLAAAKKKNYVEHYGRPETLAGWHFLTGEPASIRGLTEAMGFQYIYDEETKQYAHASGIVVATPQGKLFRYFYGIDYAPRDLRLALVEASRNKLGAMTDQLLLFCYHYDPTTGKYGLLIMRVLQAAGLGTLLALAAFMVVMFRRERRLAATGAEGKR